MELTDLEKFMAGLKRSTDNQSIKAGVVNRIKSLTNPNSPNFSQLLRNQRNATDALARAGDIDGSVEAYKGGKRLVQEIIKNEKQRGLQELNPIGRLAGGETFIDKALKLLPKTMVKGGYAVDAALNNEEANPIEKAIDASMSLNNALFLTDRLSESLTGGNLRENFQESGVTELPPEYFASKYLSF